MVLNDVLEIVRGTDQYRHRKPEGCLDLHLNRIPEFSNIMFGAIEDHVAALYISLDIPKSQRFVQAFQVCHADFLLATDVNSAQEGDVSVHRYSIDLIWWGEK